MAHKQEYLSKNQKIVLELIEKANQPLKAYSILFNVQKKGLKAPPQVYRALDKLIEMGKICLLYTSPSPRDLSTSRMPSSA